MHFIHTLTQHITPNIEPRLLQQLTKVSCDNVLGQFFAICLVRLSDKRLLGKLSAMQASAHPTPTLLEQIWTQEEQRELICQQLSATHHIDENIVKQLIYQVTPLLYHCIDEQAIQKQITLYDFLLTHLEEAKAMLPMWVDAVIPVAVLTGKEQAISEQSTHDQPQPPDYPQQSNSAYATQSPDIAHLVDIIPEETLPEDSAVDTSMQASLMRSRFSRKNKDASSKKSSALLLKVALPIVALVLIATGGWLWLGAQQQPIDNSTSATTNATVNTTANSIQANGEVQLTQANFPANPETNTATSQPAQATQANQTTQNKPTAVTDVVDGKNSQESLSQSNMASNDAPTNNNAPNNQESEQLLTKGQSFDGSTLTKNNQSMSMNRSSNDTIVFEFEDKDKNKISSAELDELVNTQIISENAIPANGTQPPQVNKAKVLPSPSPERADVESSTSLTEEATPPASRRSMPEAEGQNESGEAIDPEVSVLEQQPT